MGHTQFIPTSYQAYAVDGDGDGRKDIWNSVPDALYTAANLLKKNGWRSGQTWGYEVTLPSGTEISWRIAKFKFLNAELKVLQGRDGPAFLMIKNFFVIKRYNNADKYALGVGLLADQIAGYPAPTRDWKRPYTRISVAQAEELQKRLKQAGYYDGDVDGKPGPQTRNAIKAYQARNGLAQDGYPSLEVLSVLRRRFARSLIILLIATCFVADSNRDFLFTQELIGVTPAYAQDDKKNLLELLFKRKKANPKIQTVPKKNRTIKKRTVKKVRPKPKKNRAKKTIKKPVSARAATAPNPLVEKAEDANRILVVGDFIADGMSQGLTVAFDDVANVIIETRTNGSSGLVRDDFYNWPVEIVPIIEELKPTLVVAMLGSNDRQIMRVDGKTQKVRSELWEAEYINRVTAFAKAVRGTNTRLVWVGSPPFKFRSMSADILAFNEIYKNAVESTDGYFVDIWDGFVDEEGNFIATGSDIKGQPVRLRASDGINFTKAGKRKIAFYVERQIKQLLGDAASPLLTSLANENAPFLKLPPLQTEADLDRTNPISIEDPDLDGGNRKPPLSGENPLQAKSVRQRLVEDGVPPQAQPGRADNFSWPG
ncbi:Membrane-bound lytic murein transglycosylase B [Nymphon striatum]|nr:Membrane-bound lytic murein transglycosylase B [Nymphon striatum]